MRVLAVLIPMSLAGCAGEEECVDWFCEDGGGTKTNETGGKNGTKSTKSGTSTKDSGAFFGEFDLATETGSFTLQDDGCETTFELTNPTPESGCASCTEAWSFTVGTASGSNRCDGDDAYLGEIAIGHTPPDGLWILKDGADWYDAGGASTISGDLWEFAF